MKTTGGPLESIGKYARHTFVQIKSNEPVYQQLLYENKTR